MVLVTTDGTGNTQEDQLRGGEGNSQGPNDNYNKNHPGWCCIDAEWVTDGIISLHWYNGEGQDWHYNRNSLKTKEKILK